MFFRQIVDEKLSQYAYLVGCQTTGEALIIDPERDIDRYVELTESEGLTITAVAETHIHADFLSGAREFAERFGTKLYLSDEGDADWKYEWVKDGDYDYQLLKDGDTFRVGNISVQAVHTPGHTPGSICLVVGGAVLTGDTLFPGGPGHSRSNELLQQEIASITAQLHPLPEATVVLPGHGDTTTIGASREEYAVFASKDHAGDLHGNVLWLES